LSRQFLKGTHSISLGYCTPIRAHAAGYRRNRGSRRSGTGAGGSLTALDVVESGPDRIVVDLTCDTTDTEHADQDTASIQHLPGVIVRTVSDRTFLLHLGGRIEVTPKVPVKHRDDLSRADTAGWPGCV
jgi:malate dehydrogenase (oxaloacetate-decarboxylating)